MKISIICGKNFSYDNDLIKVNSRFVYVENYYGEIKRINRKTGEVFIEGIIIYNEENYQRSTLFIKSLQTLKYSFMWAQEKGITDEDLLGKR